MSEDGSVILDKEDLFTSSDGYSVEDAKIIGISVTINVKSGSPPTYFTVHYRLWDKKGDGVIDGSYRLYSK